MSVFTEYETQPQVIDTNIKEFVIERLKEGKAPTQIKEEVQKMYSKTISSMAVYRIRNQYTEKTGEYIPRQTKFYKNK
jgi:hypothetical protein